MNHKIFGVIFIMFFALSFVSAYNPFKWQLCDSANMTSGDCDDYWDLFKVTMGISEQNVSTDLGEFYNKTIVDSKLNSNFSSLTTLIENKIGNISTPNVTSTVNANQTQIDASIDEKIGKLRDSVDENYLSLDDYKVDNNSSGSDFNPLWIIAIILLGGGGYFYMKNQGENKQEPSQVHKGIAPSVHKKIQDKQDLQKDDKIKELEEELKKSKEKKKKGKKKKSDDDEDDDNDEDDEEGDG